MRYHWLQGIVHILSLFPLPFQRYLYEKTHWIHQPMTFEVQPGSCWIGYEIQNATIVQNALHPDLELGYVRLSPYSPPKRYIFFNFFEVYSPYLHGKRLEIVTVAREKRSQTLRFVILDYFSDTISSDPVYPFKRPNSPSMFMSPGMFYYLPHQFLVMGQSTHKKVRLPREFIEDANENIYYAHSNKPNILVFRPEDVANVYQFQVQKIYNTLWKDCRQDKPSIAYYYPKHIPFTIFPENEKSLQLCTNGETQRVQSNYVSVLGFPEIIF